MGWLYTSVFILLLSACTAPSKQFEMYALEKAYHGHVIATEYFKHKIYKKNQIQASDQLHVYLDGDGTPWATAYRIAEDPTARNPLILDLMARDKQPNILLGRPCYYGLYTEAKCENQYWTSGRYSERVVNSMAAALKQYLTGNPVQELSLIGFSGGGSLAVLIAKKIPQVKRIITLAANLDLEAWNRFHGFPSLADSLDPAQEPALSHDIQQIHFAAELDQVVPPQVIKRYVNKQKAAVYIEIKDFDHSCCWVQVWPGLMLKALQESSVAGDADNR